MPSNSYDPGRHNISTFYIFIAFCFSGQRVNEDKIRHVYRGTAHFPVNMPRWKFRLYAQFNEAIETRQAMDTGHAQTWNVYKVRMYSLINFDNACFWLLCC